MFLNVFNSNRDFRIEQNGNVPVAVSVPGRRDVRLLVEVTRSAGAGKMRLGQRCAGCGGSGGRGRRRIAPVAAELVVVGRRMTRRPAARTERNLCQSVHIIIHLYSINQSYFMLHTIVNISTHVAGYQKSCRAHQAAKKLQHDTKKK